MVFDTIKMAKFKIKKRYGYHGPMSRQQVSLNV